MFQSTSYIFILLNITAGLLTLLGSVGIFVSLIIQRRVERLQDILEELTDETYREDINLSGKIFKLIEKYQMQYLLPDRPSKTIVRYMDLTICVTIIFWSATLSLSYQPPWHWQALLFLVPMLIAFIIFFFFRQLLKNAINPLNNRLLNSIIPPPTKLRSVSFLSNYVNVSVKAILKQARLNVVIRKKNPLYDNSDPLGQVVLKEELSFDDFYYYCRLYAGNTNLFLGFGDISISFPKDEITNKPVPIERNINIPMGLTYWDRLPSNGEVTVQLLIFPRGEKHPIEYNFALKIENQYYVSLDEPEAFNNRDVIYQVVQDKLDFLEGAEKVPYLEKIQDLFVFNKKCYYLANPHPAFNVKELKDCCDEIFIN